VVVVIELPNILPAWGFKKNQQRGSNLMTTAKEKFANLTVVYSPDDGGYYAECFSKDGKDLHSTEVVSSHGKAVHLAKCWLSERGYTGITVWAE
jgi:hypothetical protein